MLGQDSLIIVFQMLCSNLYRTPSTRQPLALRFMSSISCWVSADESQLWKLLGSPPEVQRNPSVKCSHLTTCAPKFFKTWIIHLFYILWVFHCRQRQTYEDKVETQLVMHLHCSLTCSQKKTVLLMQKTAFCNSPLWAIIIHIEKKILPVEKPKIIIYPIN